MNLKELSIDQLQAMKNQTEKELAAITEVLREKVIKEESKLIIDKQ